MKKHIPNLLTCGNLFCGCLGIIFVLQDQNLLLASIMIFAAALFDFLDGFAARLLRVTSAIGKDLDSLADCVTFGLLPGFIILSIMENDFLIQKSEENLLFTHAIFLSALLIPVFSVLRLAKFNNDTRQTNSFIGLTTTANGILIGSFPIILIQFPSSSLIFYNIYFQLGFIALMCFLMVSEIPLFSFKIKSFSFAPNKIVYIFLLLSIILLIFLQSLAIPILIAVYILISIFKNMKII